MHGQYWNHIIVRGCSVRFGKARCHIPAPRGVFVSLLTQTQWSTAYAVLWEPTVETQTGFGHKEACDSYI
jgi:hypothetical protein